MNSNIHLPAFTGTLERVFDQGTFIDLNEQGEMYDRPVNSIVYKYMKPKEFDSIDTFVKEQLPEKDEVRLHLGRKGVLFLKNTYLNDHSGNCPKNDTGLYIRYRAYEKDKEDPALYIIEGFMSFSEIFKPYQLKNWLKKARKLADKEFIKADSDKLQQPPKSWVDKLKNGLSSIF